MGALNSLKLVLIVGMTMLVTACPGPRGPQGASGSGRIISTLNCGGTVVGQIGAASVLNGLEIEYDAVLTSGGDVYATAVVINGWGQTSGTAFYAADQVGAQTALVLVTDDYIGADNRGLWKISLDRTTLKTSVEYDDLDLPAPVKMTFSGSACTVNYW